MEYDVTALTVFCMTEEDGLVSFIDLYPDIPVVVVDNSPLNNPCNVKLNNMLDDKKIKTLISNGKNIGHGNGLLQGIEEIKTKYVLIFDSDVHFKTVDLLSDMFRLADNDTYGVGFTMWLGYNGERVPWRIDLPRPDGAMQYLHPFCTLISVEKYKKFAPFEKSNIKKIAMGSPMLPAMQSIHDAGKEYMIKHLPDSHYVKCKYWHHASGGTRIILRKLGLCS